MKVLIVEDDARKLAKITAVLRSSGVAVDEEVEYTGDINSARAMLLEDRYDLLILDLALPTAVDAEVRADAGLDLLSEITERPQYRAPRHILGLTGNQEALEAALGKFDEEMLTLAWYDPMTSDWADRLTRRVRQMLAGEAAAQQEPISYGCALAVVCALEDELDGLKRIHDWNWQYFPQQGDASVYYSAVVEKDGRQHRIYAAAASRMGMPASATLAMKMIHLFRPRYIGMTGVTAGMREDTRVGDILVADPSWDGGSGKWIDKDGTPQFLPHPQQLPLAPDLVHRFRRMKDNRELLDRIRRGAWPAQAPDHDLHLRIGPVASGAAVLSDGGTAALLKEQNRKLLGIEMETYGVYLAATEAPEPRPLPFSMKAVVDFADPYKDDRFRPYSIYTSAQAFRHFIEDYLL